MALRKLAFGACALFVSSAAFADNMPYNTAKDKGIKKCLPAVKKITDFLIKDSDHGSYDTWNTKSPDTNNFYSTIERTFSDGASLSNVVVSPVVSGSCNVSYDQVSFWEKSCMATKSELFPKLEYKGEVNKNITMISDGDGMTVYLMQVKGGCIAVKKETIVNGNPG